MSETSGAAEVESPSWLVPGGGAVILQPWERGAMRAEGVTIERVLKRDVVVSTGTRFRKDRLELSHGTWGVTTYLVAPDDPRVAATRTKIRVANARSNAIAAVEEYRASRATAREVATAWSRLADLIDPPTPEPSNQARGEVAE